MPKLPHSTCPYIFILRHVVKPFIKDLEKGLDIRVRDVDVSRKQEAMHGVKEIKEEWAFYLDQFAEIGNSSVNGLLTISVREGHLLQDLTIGCENTCTERLAFVRLLLS